MTDGGATTGEVLALAALDQEFVAGPDTASWLLAEALAQVGAEPLNPKDARLLWVEPGRRPGVDRVLYFACGSARVALVTALRLVAPTRLLQSVDREGAALIEERRADFAFTVLIGGGAAGVRFDCLVPLDRLAAAVAERAARTDGELARRIDHVAGLIVGAGLQARRAEQAQEATEAERFCVEYLSLIEDAAPMLRCPEAPPLPLETLVFPESTLPSWPFMPEVRLVHGLRQGVAGIRFVGWGREIEGLAAVMEPSLRGADYMLARSEAPDGAGCPDALLITPTPRLDPVRSLDGQYDAARECVEHLRDMQRWYESRRAAARYWAEFCEPRPTRGYGARVTQAIRL